jgi:hypothetical protein
VVLLLGFLALSVLGLVVLGAVLWLRSAPVAAPPTAVTSVDVTTEARAEDHVEVAPKPDAAPDKGLDEDAKPAEPNPPAPAPEGNVAAPTKNLAWRRGPARLKMLEDGGGNVASEAAVSRGLDWLVSKQRNDGSWMSDGNEKNPVAGTALALLPLLGAGEGAKDEHTKHEAAVIKGLDFLVKQQRPDGRLGVTFVHQGMAALALCEGLQLTGNAKYRMPAQQVINSIMRFQHAAGGWRFQPNQPGDTSSTSWQIQALKAAKDARLNVNAPVLTKAEGFLDSMSSENGMAYGLMSRTPGASPSAMGLFDRVLLGWSPHKAEVLGGIARLKLVESTLRDSSWDSYFYYYATHLSFQAGGKPWEDWNQKVRDFLIAAQLPAGDWPKDSGQVGLPDGKHVSTCLALLTLEVYYRYPRPKVLIGD